MKALLVISWHTIIFHSTLSNPLPILSPLLILPPLPHSPSSSSFSLLFLILPPLPHSPSFHPSLSPSLPSLTPALSSSLLQRETTDLDAAESLPKSPLEHLEDVLAEIPNDQSYILKRELLIGVVSDSSKSLRDTGAPSM
jgi:hypothetical protein